MPLLSLPRELRNNIYHYYLFEADGYHFDFASGKLRASCNRPIDLALMYTCSTIAAEMRHLALGCNVINFWTVGTENERLKALHFHKFLSDLEHWRSRLLDTRIDSLYHRFKTPDLDAKAALRYPQFEPLLHVVRDRRYGQSPLCEPSGWINGWGAAESTFRGFENYLLELLSEETEYLETSIDLYDRKFGDYANFRLLESRDDLRPGPEPNWGYFDNESEWNSRHVGLLRSRYLFSSPQPWSIPSAEELAQMRLMEEPREEKFRERVRWRFSAAAAAIHFLGSASQTTRLAIRNIVLHEDRYSVARAECHMLGFIPFCSHNLKLHVERRVNIWRNIAVTPYIEDMRHLWGQTGRLEHLSNNTSAYPEERDYYSAHCAQGFIQNCGRWIAEATELVNNGMPAHSFSLVLDGDPAPDQSSDLFELVKEYAALQVAQIKWYNENSLTPDFKTLRVGGVYLFDKFPEVLSDIVGGGSFISCNFPTGNPYDPEQLLNRYRHLPFYHGLCPGKDWQTETTVKIYQTYGGFRFSPPLPPYFCDLGFELIIPDGEEHSENTIPSND